MEEKATVIDTHQFEEALKFLESFDILNKVDGASVREMIRKKEEERKEHLVLEKHLNTQGKPYTIRDLKYNRGGKPVTKWVTRAPWKGCDAKIMKDSYSEVIEELYSHYYPDSKNRKEMTLQEVFDQWIEKRKKSESVSSMTLIHNKADWSHFMKGEHRGSNSIVYERSPLLEKRITDISALQIRELYEEIVGNHKTTKSAFNNFRGLIIGAFSYAFNEGMDCIDASRVSTSGLHFKEPKDNSEDVYKPEEREKLLSYIESLPHDCYTLSVRLMFTLCIRISELRALTWNDIDYSDPDRPVMKIRHQLVDKEVGATHRKAIDVDYMKAHSPAGKRSFPLSEYALEVLSELHRLNPNSKYICTNKGGVNPIYTNKFNEHLKKYCEGAGIPYRSSHKIRFYAVSQMYDMGMNEKDIMTLAGHSNVSTTRHYNRRLKEIDMTDEQLRDGFGRKNA